MDRSDLLDKIEEIQHKNYNFFRGTNEAELHTREEIADLFFEIINSKKDAELSEDSVIKTFKEHRFERNPQEKIFVDEFLKQHSEYNDMDLIVFGHAPENTMPKDYLSQREKNIVISVIQWLGSPVGKGFLCMCGYTKNKM